MKRSKGDTAKPSLKSKDLTLPEVFPENQVQVPPLSSDMSGSLPPSQELNRIPLPKRLRPPRVLIADDDARFFESLKRSLENFYPDQMDLRFWSPDVETPDLLEVLRQYQQEGWQPDAMVIDINFDCGGKHGVDYLKDLRWEPGCVALPVVLTTGNQLRDLEEDRLRSGDRNWTGEKPSRWLSEAALLEPEAILYGKTGDAVFLGRIGEQLDDWRRTARRRSWVKLLRDVATMLDEPTAGIMDIPKTIVRFVVNELQMEWSFVRFRREHGRYELIACYPENKFSNHREPISIDEVPVLREIVEQSREAIIRGPLTLEDVGSNRSDIVGKRLLGVGTVLGKRNVGFITMIQPANFETLYDQIDCQYISVLARLLASAIRVGRLRDRQTELLKFATAAGSAKNQDEVCRTLAESLHIELHQQDNQNAKVMVRLLDFGTGELKRRALIGLKSNTGPLFITTEGGVYATVINKNTSLRIRDTKKYTAIQHACDGKIRSELCVPLSIGRSVIGAVNLEHRHVDFYRRYDEEFVKAAAALAANAIERIRNAQVLDGMTNFVYQFAHEDSATLNKHLRNLLYIFCGYSVLVDLALSTDTNSYWAVQGLDFRFAGIDEKRVQEQVERAYREGWETSWVGSLFKAEDWRDHWASFTNEEGKFGKVELIASDGSRLTQKADAVLWLRRSEVAPPHRAILLMWALPPPMGEVDIVLLGRMARLFSELDNRQTHIRELLQKNIIGEEVALVGHVMQHFRHRLGSLTGGMSNHIDRVEIAFKRHDQAAFGRAIADLRANAGEIAGSFHRSRGYVKAIELKVVAVIEIIAKARQDLETRLAAAAVSVSVPDGLMARTDPEIAALVLYSLLENALDATAGQQSPQISVSATDDGRQIVLRVTDNGCGVSAGFQSKLFQWGETTKTQGLGSALAFARARMRLLQGDLIFPLPQPSTGAIFEMRLACPPTFKETA